MKKLIKKYKHSWLLLYFPLYMVWFFYLEEASPKRYTPIEIPLDSYIPFNEWFIIPYYMWFVFIFVTVAYLFFNDVPGFYRCVAFLFIGMSICLLIYTIWPTGQDMRPDLSTIGRDNIALRITKFLYGFDSNTNICPSIHVYNSVGVCLGIMNSKKIKTIRPKTKKCVIIFYVTLATLICLSTVFLKQHSAIDIVCAFILAAIMYVAVYVPDYKKKG